MNETQIKELFDAFANKVTQAVQANISELTERVGRLEIPNQIKEYEPISVVTSVTCEEPLDIVKTLPEFAGDEARYVSWRQAAFAAYKLFEPYRGSSKYYQAVAIVRNKIVGRADATLASFNTVLNFQAIIARLDFSFSDKRPIYLIEQELSTLRQGHMSVNKFYEEVEKKLTLIINKVIMTHEGNSELIITLNDKYRSDALRVFISGLNKPLCNILFSSKPGNLPSALALAQELVSNNARYAFANAFENSHHGMYRYNYSPHYQSISNIANKKIDNSQTPVPMEVDPSTRRFVRTAGNTSAQNRTMNSHNINRSNIFSNRIQDRNRFNVFNNENRPTGRTQQAPNNQQRTNHIETDECNFLG